MSFNYISVQILLSARISAHCAVSQLLNYQFHIAAKRSKLPLEYELKENRDTKKELNSLRGETKCVVEQHQDAATTCKSTERNMFTRLANLREHSDAAGGSWIWFETVTVSRIPNGFRMSVALWITIASQSQWTYYSQQITFLKGIVSFQI
ncbi:uncharacterized protein [Physcomitrium patens]|uniref:Uncharacterized protein n=1 Tax=Physcomitrium patens TaxID=3218 RepID=A0A7I4EH25_PHYPA|nr:uncharacterized protein LOC112285719 [Physcomitrium patens]|eukprot:XP_024382536.1 uncharacterized protein LOC112285719 [Physcomitrella patens]